MRDTKAPALRVRWVSVSAKSCVFEAKLGRAIVRRTLADIRSHNIELDATHRH